MFPFTIHEMAVAAADAADAPNATKQIESALADYWADKIACVWTSEDVHTRSNELGRVLTEGQARDALFYTLHHWDAADGLSWSSFDDDIEARGRKMTDVELEDEERMTVLIDPEKEEVPA
jgi:hypothetical protein